MKLSPEEVEANELKAKAILGTLAKKDPLDEKFEGVEGYLKHLVKQQRDVVIALNDINSRLKVLEERL